MTNSSWTDALTASLDVGIFRYNDMPPGPNTLLASSLRPRNLQYIVLFVNVSRRWTIYWMLASVSSEW